MRTAVLVAVFAIISVSAIDIDLATRNEGEQGVLSDTAATVAGATTTSFVAPGGLAAVFDTTTLLLDSMPACRLLHVDGEYSGKNAEIVLVTASMPKLLRDWVKSFIAGKYKKRKVALVIKTGVGPAPKKESLYSRFEYKGAMIREVTFPLLGAENGNFRIRLIYQSANEVKGQKPNPMLDVPVRSQFFQFTMQGKDGKDKLGHELGRSVTRISPFTIGRSGGFGKQDKTTLRITFPATTTTTGATTAVGKIGGNVGKWKQWADHRKMERHGKLTLYYWSGTSMDRRSEAARGQLKVLFELHLNDITLDKLEAADGKANLIAANVDMSDH